MLIIERNIDNFILKTEIHKCINNDIEKRKIYSH